MKETMKLGHTRVLLGDFKAARWIARNDPSMDADRLRKRFCAIHEFFIRNVRRSRPGLFKGVNPDLFVDVIRKWIVLYDRCLEHMRRRFPRQAGTVDLELDGTNWSEELGITAEGLLEIGYFSRYAEVWAEKALKAKSWYDSYELRCRFLETPAFWHLFSLTSSEQLNVVDDLGNGVTPFDLIGVARSPLHTGDYRAALEGLGWTIRSMNDTSVQIIEWYAKHGPTHRCPDVLAA